MSEDLVQVQLETPYAGNTELHIAYLHACKRDCLLNHDEAPFASHWAYTHALDDSVPEERKLGIKAGLVIDKHAERSVFYLDFGISLGMLYGLEHAYSNERRIDFRLLPPLILTDLLENFRYRNFPEDPPYIKSGKNACKNSNGRACDSENGEELCDRFFTKTERVAIAQNMIFAPRTLFHRTPLVEKLPPRAQLLINEARTRWQYHLGE